MLLPMLLGLRVAALALGAALPCEAGESGLRGTTVEYADAGSAGHPELAWFARAYVAPEAKAHRPVPLLIFLHGVNRDLVKYPWMGGGATPDLRPLIGRMIRDGQIGPLVIAAPSSIAPDEVQYTSWAHFDVDRFVERTIAALGDDATIDPSRIVLAGHSGAGCHSAGGIASANSSARRLFAVLSIDTCLYFWHATELAKLPGETRVVVTYQTRSWRERPFEDFAAVFRRAAAEAANGGSRVIEELYPPPEDAHVATVAMSLERWLPRLLTPSN